MRVEQTDPNASFPTKGTATTNADQNGVIIIGVEHHVTNGQTLFFLRQGLPIGTRTRAGSGPPDSTIGGSGETYVDITRVRQDSLNGTTNCICGTIGTILGEQIGGLSIRGGKGIACPKFGGR